MSAAPPVSDMDGGGLTVGPVGLVAWIAIHDSSVLRSRRR